MERGPFQSEAFTAFAADVVLFLHVTSRTPDEPEPKLLQRVMGKQSWPSIAFLDSDGARCARQRERTVEGFSTTLGLLQDREALRRRAESDADAERELFELDLLTLDALDFPAAQARHAKLKGFAPDTLRAIEARIIDLEVAHHVMQHSEGERMVLAEALTKMLNAGRIPTASSPAYAFWSNILYGAEQKGDIELYARGVEGFERAFGKDEGMKFLISDYQEKLAKMRALDSEKPTPRKR